MHITGLGLLVFSKKIKSYEFSKRKNGRNFLLVLANITIVTNIYRTLHHKFRIFEAGLSEYYYMAMFLESKYDYLDWVCKFMQRK